MVLSIYHNVFFPPVLIVYIGWVGGHSAHPSLAAQQVKVAKTTGKQQVFNQSNLLLNGQLYKTESFWLPSCLTTAGVQVAGVQVAIPDLLKEMDSYITEKNQHTTASTRRWMQFSGSISYNLCNLTALRKNNGRNYKIPIQKRMENDFISVLSV